MRDFTWEPTKKQNPVYRVISVNTSLGRKIRRHSIELLKGPKNKPYEKK